MFCEYCGKEIPEGHAFCVHCGAPVDQTEMIGDTPFREEGFDPPETYAPENLSQPDPYEEYDFDQEQEPKGKPKWLLPVLFLGLAALSVAAGMFVAGMVSDHNDGKDADPAAAETTIEEEAEEAAEETETAEEEAAADLDGAQQRVYASKNIGDYAENTIASFDEAIRQNAECVEQDVVMAADGTLFVSHDRGYNGMPAGAIASDGIPRLEDVFQRYGTEITYVVEIKANDTAASYELLSLIDEYELQDNIIVQSFYPGILREVKRELPEAPSIILHNNGDMNQVTFDEALRLDCADTVAVSREEGMMTESNCRAAHQAGKRFAVWDLSEKQQILDAIEMDVDCYFTNAPALALDLEKNYR
ncbi:MAG: zinc-ribbon domain-containing protein [Firmicutes bacterium]|nr:zinc-ribbon domain-containing protein [Bacillota bacterium]